MPGLHPNDEVSVLLVDDDQICRLGVKRALRKCQLANRVYEAHDGCEALDLLRGANGQKQVPRPITVILDLNMPRMNGFEFLDEIRDDADLSTTNVFVITTSSSVDDIHQCYARHVCGYVTKSGHGDSFGALARMLREFWQVVTLI